MDNNVIAYQELGSKSVEYGLHEIRINECTYPVLHCHVSHQLSRGQVVPATAKIKFLWQVMPGEEAYHLGVAEWAQNEQGDASWMVSFLSDVMPLD